MNEQFRKMVETFLGPWIEERMARKVVYWLFWLTTACLGWLFIATNPVFGLFVVGAPVLLVWLTSRQGLGGVNGVLLGVVLALTLVPAFFLGMAQKTADGEDPTGFVLAGLLIFLVWVAAFPTMLVHVDRHRGKKRGEQTGDPFADYRVIVVRLWMATIVMAMVGESLAAVVCLVALLYRRKWTAGLAGLGCLVFPLLTIAMGEIWWDAGPIEVIAAVVSAWSWYGAVRNPHWGVAVQPRSTAWG